MSEYKCVWIIDSSGFTSSVIEDPVTSHRFHTLSAPGSESDLSCVFGQGLTPNSMKPPTSHLLLPLSALFPSQLKLNLPPTY